LKGQILKAHRELLDVNSDYKRLVEKHGLIKFTPRLERSPYESLVRSIAFQQLHGNAARTILGRLMAHTNKVRMADAKSGAKGLSAEEVVELPFPEPAQLLKIQESKFREFGFSASKTKAILDIALKRKQGIIPEVDELVSLSDLEIIERLTQAYGVGPWTVQMMLIFQMGRLDVWPVTDFGIQAGFKHFYRKRLHPKPKDLQRIGEQWKPSRTLAALYLWREADSQK
jgi:3-methyladenine DNA glycosylase/8-oxoguanine DNA glycosylase